MKDNSISHSRISNFNSVTSATRVTAIILSYSLAVIGSHGIFDFVSHKCFLLENSP